MTASPRSPSPRVKGAGRKRRSGPVPPAAPAAKTLAALQERIGYEFSASDVLIEALTHASVDQGAADKPARVNERLEFLGDRVLGLLAARALLSAYPTAPEGELAPRLNALVRKETCAEVALECGLGQAIILAAAEKSSGGASKPAILGDACEALLAAIYLDGGVGAAQAFFDRFWGDRIDAQDTVPRDAKTVLQEWVQARTRATPTYTVVARSGPDHAPHFEVEVSLPDAQPARGEGPSKRAAERAAARALLAREGVVTPEQGDVT